jgi:hypothetical protein
MNEMKKNGMNEEKLRFGPRQHKLEALRVNQVGFINLGANFGRKRKN